MVENFYGFKIISSKMGSQENNFRNLFPKNFGSKSFIVSKLFPPLQVIKKKLRIISSKTHLQGKIFETNYWEMFLVKKCYGWKNNFLENWIGRKKFWENLFETNFWSKMYFVCKIISSKTGFQKKKIKTFFYRKFFIGAKLFPGKQVPKKVFFEETFWEKRFDPKFLMVAK